MKLGPKYWLMSLSFERAFTYRGSVKFAFPESRWVLAQGTGKPIEEMLDDGGAIVEFGVQDANPFLRWLLTFRRQADVLSPSTMADQLARMRNQVARLYA